MRPERADGMEARGKRSVAPGYSVRFSLKLQRSAITRRWRLVNCRVGDQGRCPWLTYRRSFGAQTGGAYDHSISAPITTISAQQESHQSTHSRHQSTESPQQESAPINSIAAQARLPRSDDDQVCETAMQNRMAPAHPAYPQPLTPRPVFALSIRTSGTAKRDPPPS